ncbi:MAG: Uma2 family endonuclease [Deltaproteobacteria bacterium]
MSTARRVATYADLLALPDNVIGEIIAGELHAMPRPRIRHASAASQLGAELVGAFGHKPGGPGGPGGWHILFEPELHLGLDVLVPDLAGWRRETLPELPDEAFIDVAPDWVCEVLSRSTERHDRIRKMRVYARERVGHVWLLSPELETLEVCALDGQRYALAQAFDGDEPVRAEPFDAIELDLAAVWGKR